VNQNVPAPRSRGTTSFGCRSFSTAWPSDDANQPALQEGACYRCKDVEVQEYRCHLELHVNRNSGIDEISSGVGYVPVEDRGEDEQLETAADVGVEIECVKGRVHNHFRIRC